MYCCGVFFLFIIHHKQLFAELNNCLNNCLNPKKLLMINNFLFQTFTDNLNTSSNKKTFIFFNLKVICGFYTSIYVENRKFFIFIKNFLIFTIYVHCNYLFLYFNIKLLKHLLHFYYTL